MIKKSFFFMMLMVVAAALLVFNLYLRRLESNTQHHIADLQQQVGLHLRENKMLNDRNDALRLEVENLRSPDSYYSYEEKAREDYGMIGKNETYPTAKSPASRTSLVLPKKSGTATRQPAPSLAHRRYPCPPTRR